MNSPQGQLNKRRKSDEIGNDRIPLMMQMGDSNWLKYEWFVSQYHEAKYGGKVWHWSVVPESVLVACGFIHSMNTHRLMRIVQKGKGVREYGLDAIAEDEHGYHGIQAKLWTNTLCAKDLGTFFCVMACSLQEQNPASHGYLYHTTKLQIDLANNIQRNSKFSAHYLAYEAEETMMTTATEKEFTLYPVQARALSALLKYYTKNTDSEDTDSEDPDEMESGSESETESGSDTERDCMVTDESERAQKRGAALLQMACAAGKTIVVAHLLKELQPPSIIIASPLRVHAKQIFKRIKDFLPNYHHLLVDSDDDAISAHDVCQPTESTMISTTFKSLPILMRNVSGFLIIDEAHNLTPAEFEFAQTKNALLVTATPSFLLAEHASVIFEYSMREGIEDGLVCSYEVRLPVTEEIIVPSDISENSLTKCAMFLMSGMLETGARRCILYCSTIDECTQAVTKFAEICEKYHGLVCWTGTVTADTSQKKRDELLKEFSNSQVISVLASVRILNEGIDIPKCDSVCFTRTTTNETVALQRMCRANRKDKDNKHKIAQIFVFAELDVSIGMLASLKYCDPEFLGKICLVSANYDSKISIETLAKISEEQPKIVETIRLKSATVEDIFETRFQLLWQFIQTNNRRPNPKQGENVLGNWLASHIQYYKKKAGIMRIPSIRKKWETLHQFSCMFSDERRWRHNYQELREGFQKGISPSERSAIGIWFNVQKVNYRARKKSMINEEKRKEFEILMAEFPKFFRSNEEKWMDNCQELKSSFQDGYLPTQKTSLGKWFNVQKMNYKAKAQIMQHEKIRKEFETLMTEFPMFFKSYEEKWRDNLQEFTKFMEKEHRRPGRAKEEENRLAIWLRNSLRNYQNKTQIMKNDAIRREFEGFCKKFNI